MLVLLRVVRCCGAVRCVVCIREEGGRREWGRARVVAGLLARAPFMARASRVASSPIIIATTTTIITTIITQQPPPALCPSKKKTQQGRHPDVAQQAGARDGADQRPVRDPHGPAGRAGLPRGAAARRRQGVCAQRRAVPGALCEWWGGGRVCRCAALARLSLSTRSRDTRAAHTPQTRPPHPPPGPPTHPHTPRTPPPTHTPTHHRSASLRSGGASR